MITRESVVVKVYRDGLLISSRVSANRVVHHRQNGSEEVFQAGRFRVITREDGRAVCTLHTKLEETLRKERGG